MYRVLTTTLTLALLAAPVAVYADDKGKSHGNNDKYHDNGKNKGHSKHHDDNDEREAHAYNQGYKNGYKAQHYAWQASANNPGNWKNYRNYSYYRPAPGQTRYYANQYYRDASYYQPRYVASNERIYRGQDDRYYCRRSDGTTGLIIGGLSGGTLGAALAPGGSQTLGALIGGSLGAVVGSSIDKGQVTCR